MSFYKSLAVVGAVVTACLIASTAAAAAPSPDNQENLLKAAATAPAPGDSTFKTAAAYDVQRGPNQSQRYILTYDDCPLVSGAAFTATMQWLKSHGFGIAIAPTGDCLNQYKAKYNIDLAAVARANGQYVINHSVTHTKLTTLKTKEEVMKELRAPGVVTNFGRPPYGMYDVGPNHVREAYAAVNMNIWVWHFDTIDWRIEPSLGNRRQNADELAAKLVANLNPGQTVLLHMQWNGFTPTAMGKMFVRLYQDRGLVSCRVYRGMDNTGPALPAPVMLPANLPC